MSGPPVKSIVADTVLFCRALRENGVAVTPAEAVAAVRALRLIDIGDRLETFVSLRSVLTSRVEDFPVFEELFEEFWSQLGHKGQQRVKTQRESHSEISRRVPPRSHTPAPKGLAFFLENCARTSGHSEHIDAPSASDIESNAQKDFGQFG